MTLDDTASEMADYIVTPKSILVTTQSSPDHVLTLQIVDDAIVENEETFLIGLFVSDLRADIEVTIMDNDDRGKK